ncbi:exported protein [Candidatus Thiomargarita nelsonii]|uniref:Exported protein n=1 Tax=Candidatus Thiomargarita nelsonii TaxID=1003181 RepID=A0A176S328_9GAMM|nr:exported protein [Candidatus Thiomargarita nelsonii]
MTAQAEQATSIELAELLEVSSQQLNFATSQLNSVERILSTVQRSKRVSKQDLNLGKKMHAYAQAMNEAHKSARSRQALQQFKAVAKRHLARFREMDKKVLAVDKGIKSGVIILSKPALQKFTPQERKEFQRYLAPGAKSKYRSLYPSLIDADDIFEDTDTTKSEVAAVEGCCSAGSFVGLISDFLIKPAEAGSWKKCWKAYKKCRKRCGKCWKPWTWGCKWRCTKAYIRCIFN